MVGTTVAVFTAFLAATATALKAPTTWKNAGNNLNCPAAHQSMFTGPRGGKWGIMCGWDTESTTYYKGPYVNLGFEQCVLQCGQTPGCEIATFTGDCYLKKSAKGLGYKTTNSNNRLAIKLN